MNVKSETTKHSAPPPQAGGQKEEDVSRQGRHTVGILAKSRKLLSELHEFNQHHRHCRKLRRSPTVVAQVSNAFCGIILGFNELASPNRFFRSLVPLRSMLNLTTDMFASQFYSLAITYPQMCCSLDGNSQESARNSCAPPIPWLQICTTSRQHWKHQQLLLCSSRNLEHNWHGFQRLTLKLALLQIGGEEKI